MNARTIDAYNAMAAKLDNRERGPIFPELPDAPAISGVGPRDKVILTCGANLTPQPVRWLWQYWLAMGKLHILAGAPYGGNHHHRGALARRVTVCSRERADLEWRR